MTLSDLISVFSAGLNISTMAGDAVLWRSLTWMKQAVARAPPGGLRGPGNQRTADFHHAAGSARVSGAEGLGLGLGLGVWQPDRVSETGSTDAFGVRLCLCHLVNTTTNSDRGREAGGAGMWDLCKSLCVISKSNNHLNDEFFWHIQCTQMVLTATKSLQWKADCATWGDAVKQKQTKKQIALVPLVAPVSMKQKGKQDMEGKKGKSKVHKIQNEVRKLLLLPK